MLLLTLKFYRMLIIPFSLVGHKRKSCLAQIYFLIFCTLIHSNQAGVIKKRATQTSGNIDLDIKETKVVPTILTALNNATVSSVTTKLQSVVGGGNFATETSKELTNNEIFNNEAKKLGKEMQKEEEEEKVITVKNATKTKTKNEEVNSKNISSTTTILEDDNRQDFKQVQQNLEEKKQPSATETPKTTNEFSSNDIKEENIPKLLENQQTNTIPTLNADSNNYESSSSLENTLKINDKNPRPPSKILSELRMATEKPTIKSISPDNAIENKKELIEKNDLRGDSEDKVTIKPRELNSTPTTNNEETVIQTKSLETSANTLETKEEQTELASTETITSVTQDSENIRGLKMSKADPLNVTESKDHHYSTNVESQEYQSNRIQDELKRQELLNSAKSQNMVLTTTETPLTFKETTLKSMTKENEEADLLIFEGDKKQYARSMFKAETTTLNYWENDDDDEEALNTVTTYRPIILSIKQGVEETTQESLKTAATIFNLKEKKPKFINDNSTNAQQLNLPNNAEVWSLAAMKSLPKANISMETAQAHNQTNKDIKENELYNTSLSLNNNSEKNLLDWSQIMMDKELSTTTRTEDVTNQEEFAAEKKKLNNFANQESKIEMEREMEMERKDKESVMRSTTPAAGLEENAPFKLQAIEDVITKNSLIEPELTTSTMSSITTSTILSLLNYNENDNENNKRPDKKVEENMNNHIDTLTATLTTTIATNVANNKPFNTSLNIEPNLNKINLTSNQTQIDLNDDVQHTATTSGKKNVNDNVNADADADTNETTTARETNTEAATTTSTTTTTVTTKSTAVFEMTTVEQISSDTTTVSTLETVKQNVSLNNIVNIQQPLQKQQNQNQINNVINEETNSSLSASHNELENVVVVDKQSGIQNENIIDLNTKTITTTTTTTVVPITTFRPNILAITASTTSIPATFEQEVDQNRNEIQTNLTNTEQQKQQQQQQSIIKIDSDFHNNHSTKAIETHLTEREFETTTFEAVTDTATTTATEQTATELTVNKKENTLTSSLENETTTATTTSSARREQINETSEINLDLIETTTAAATTATTTTVIQTTPKQVNENKNRGYEETTTGSSVLKDEKFEKGSKTATTTETATEINFSSKTSTETPVVIRTESGKAFLESTTPTTTTEENKSAATTAKQESDTKENNLSEDDVKIETTTQTKIMNNTQEIKATTIDTMMTTAVKEEETYINLLDDTTTTQSYTATISTTAKSLTPTNTTTTLSSSTPPPSPTPSSSSELPLAETTRVEEIYNVINSTTTELIQTTTQQLLTEISKESSFDPPATTTTTNIYSTEMLPPAATTTHSSQIIGTANIGKSLPTLTSIMGGNSGNMYPKNSEASGETDINVIIAITVSVIGVIALILLVGFLYIMRKRQKQTSYSQRCRPVSLDEYTIDNASVGGSMRKSSALRASKRTYGNLAFDDPALRPNPMGVHDLAKFVQEKLRIFEEFRDVPQITSRLDEVPTGCEDKNRYANVLPLPETRVILQRLNDDEKSEYINANYVTGPKDPPNYYIACQAPLESTVEDFWRMIWEQQSRVIIQATDLIENGVEKCAEYLPPSVTLDNHCSFGDFQITLQNREVKDKYAISTILLKHVGENATRELTHYWYKWPEVGVPTDETPLIAMLLEARSSLISYAIEQANEDKEKSSMATLKSVEDVKVSANDSTTMPAKNSNGSSANGSTGEINGNISMVHIKKAARNQGPLTVHCSPGTGRTGTIIACDIAIRSLETPKRTVDIPQIVYYVRRGRASAVLTKEQYEFIYKVANMYAAKITNPTNYN